ncbi:MAG: ribosome assembly cofactor RimP [Prevotellaceae bacterium]|jgi:ribosome maturation factor RimP|nr:ribosome assembly cofactor RimP [Prevotellaceae bacterium]
MIDKELITKIVEDNIAGTDMFIVYIKVKTGNFISIVLDSDSAVSIDNCADINKAVCENLNSKGEDDFEVSVYSAGLSEPLMLKRQYIKHIGKEVEVLRKSGGKQKGILASIDEDSIELEYAVSQKEEGIKKKKIIQTKERIRLESIKSTKLVVTI